MGQDDISCVPGISRPVSDKKSEVGESPGSSLGVPVSVRDVGRTSWTKEKRTFELGREPVETKGTCST